MTSCLFLHPCFRMPADTFRSSSLWGGDLNCPFFFLDIQWIVTQVVPVLLQSMSDTLITLDLAPLGPPFALWDGERCVPMRWCVRLSRSGLREPVAEAAPKK